MVECQRRTVPSSEPVTTACSPCTRNYDHAVSKKDQVIIQNSPASLMRRKKYLTQDLAAHAVKVVSMTLELVLKLESGAVPCICAAVAACRIKGGPRSIHRQPVGLSNRQTPASTYFDLWVFQNVYRLRGLFFQQRCNRPYLHQTLCQKCPIICTRQ